MYGVTVRPSSTTGRTGAPAIASGGTGCTADAILTRNIFSRACGSKSNTSTCHSGRPDSLSRACTRVSLDDLSESSSAVTSPTTPKPCGNSSPHSTLNGPETAMADTFRSLVAAYSAHQAMAARRPGFDNRETRTVRDVLPETQTSHLS